MEGGKETLWCGLCQKDCDYSLEYALDKVLWVCKECDGILDLTFKKSDSDPAVKADEGKPPVGWIPYSVLVEVAKVLNFGARKYDRDNWRKGMEWSRMVNAALRHLGAWNEGEDLDPETGISHLAHALCCLIFLLWYWLKGVGTDDRYKDNVGRGSGG